MANKKKEEVTEVEVVTKEENNDEEKETITGLSKNLEIVLVYLISILGFVFSLMKDKKVSSDVRFHYNQAGTLWIVNMVLTVLGRVGSKFLGPIGIGTGIISLLIFIFTIIAIVKGCEGIKYEIPVVSEFSKSIWKEE